MPVNLSGRGIPLREQKIAATKRSILLLTLEKMKSSTFEDINVEDLCRELGIAKRTFFNYFPCKAYVILYMLQIWILEISEHLTVKYGSDAGLILIYSGFDEFGKKIMQQPRLANEIISCLFRSDTDVSTIPPLTGAEKLLWSLDPAFQREGPQLGFKGLVASAVRNAIRTGELPAGTDQEAVELGLNSILVGIPFSLKDAGIDNVRTFYKSLLDIFMNGLKGRY